MRFLARGAKRDAANHQGMVDMSSLAMAGCFFPVEPGIKLKLEHVSD